MKAKSRSFVRGLLLAILTCVFVIALAACGFGGTDEKPAPEVKNVTITAAEGAEPGKVDEEHVLSYTATNGSEITVSVKKGTAEAVSGTDYTFNKDSKILVFKAEGAYTVTVTAKLNDKTGSASANITITAKGSPVVPVVPEVELTVTAQGIAGYVGAAYEVAYTVNPEETQVAITVKKGEAAAVKDTDYTLNGSELKFLAAGTYTVVATPAGGEAKESDEITIVVPTVSVTAKETAERGELIPLTIATTPAGLTVSVTVVDATGANVEASKYEYNATDSTIKIKATGDYKIKATIVGTEASDTTDTITITKAPVPAFNLTSDHTTVEENAVATISVEDIEYPHEGDEMGSSSWKVEYSADGSDYADVTANDCVWTEAERTIKPLKVGSYKITHSITCTGGHTGSESIVITATPATLTLAATTQGWQNAASAIDLDYTVEGYANNYNVSYATKAIVGQGEVTKNSATEKQAASSVNVTGAAAIVAEYTVTYTHSMDDTAKYSVTFYVYGNATDGPAFGSNVTHNVLLPNVALKLYADEAQGATVSYTLLDEDKAEITDLANVGKIITLKDGATGKIHVAVLATKDGKSSLAMQIFTVGARGGNNAMNNYYTAVTGDSHTGISYNWLDNNNNVHKNDTLLTKEGFVFNRDNKDGLDGGDMVQIPLNENGANKKNLQLEFDFTILGRHGEDNSNKSKNVSLAVFFRPAQDWGGNNQIAMYSDNESGMNTYTGTAKVAGTNPMFPEGSIGLGYKIHVRITRMIANSKVLYLAEWKSAGSDTYTTWLTITANEENSGTTMGSPLTYIQFTHECGSYAIENLTFNGALELPTINATLDKETMRLNETAALTYSLANAISGDVTMKVYSGNTELASDKYTYEGNTLSFVEAGTYKIVLTAFGAATVEKTITVNPVPTVSVSLPSVVKVDTAATLTVTVNNSNKTATVKVQKLNGETYQDISTGYTYANNEITFAAVGTYKVIASIEDGAIYGEATVIVANASAPTFTVSASQPSVTEGETVTMTASAVTYDTANSDAEGDGVVTYTVLYRAGGNDYAEIAENANEYYTISGNSVTLKMAGDYRIVGSVTSALGITGTASADVTAAPAVVSLAFDGKLTNGWYRMVANDTDTDIAYTVSGATNYNVTYENGSASQNGAGKVNVHWTEPNTYLVKVIYTHKMITTAKYELTIKVSAVSDLATSPILGEDPFGGTYKTLAPALAMALYSDVKAANGTDAFAGVIEYSIASNNVKKSNGEATGVAIQKANNQVSYVLVQDWDTAATKSSSGTVVVKMTVKDGDTVVAAASQEFTVAPLANDNGATVNAYFQTVMAAYGNTDNALDISQFTMRYREHACITKGGIILNRENQGWLEGADFGRIYVVDKGTTASTQAQWQIDYKVTLYGFNNDDFCLKQYFHVGDGEKGAGNIDVKKASGGEIDSWGWLTATGTEEGQSGAEEGCYLPAAADLPTIYVRITRTVNNGVVTLMCSFSEDGTTYKRAYERHGETISATNQGNIGAPLNYVRLEKTNAASYGIEYVKVTSLDN